MSGFHFEAFVIFNHLQQKALKIRNKAKDFAWSNRTGLVKASSLDNNL